MHIPGYLKFFLHEIEHVEETTEKEMDDWKATPRDNMILKIPNGALTDGPDHNRNYNFWMLPDNVLPIHCYFLAVISFFACLWNNAHAYLLTFGLATRLDKLCIFTDAIQCE